MNVIISNERQAELANLDIEIIKSIHGVFDVDELIQMFSNFFFGRMILDLTALKNYQDVRNLQKLSMSLDVEKIIILLPAVYTVSLPLHPGYQILCADNSRNSPDRSVHHPFPAHTLNPMGAGLERSPSNNSFVASQPKDI